MSTPEQTRRLYFPVYPQQAAFLSATEPVKGFVGGQGCGKSKIGAYDLLRRVQAGCLYAVITPTYPMMRDATFRSFREVAQQTCQWIDFHRSDFTAFVRAPAGGTAEVLFRSGENPDRLRGPNLSGCWLDEASMLDHEAFQIMVARLREGGRAGWLTATFTPKGLGHWTFEVFGKPRPGVFLVHSRTSDNPFLAEEFITQVSREYAGLRAEQELEGRFISIEGAEWPPEYFGDILFTDWPPDLALSVMALDPSKGKGEGGDYSAFVLLGLGRDGVLYADADLSKYRTPTQLVETGLALWRQFGAAAFAVEVNMWQELLGAEFLRVAEQFRVTLPLYGINNLMQKEVRIRGLGPYLAQAKLRIRDTPGGKILLQQLRDFPEAEHDDGPDALQMGVVMMEKLMGNQVQRDDPVLMAV